jgi:hypothetical protein
MHFNSPESGDPTLPIAQHKNGQVLVSEFRRKKTVAQSAEPKDAEPNLASSS